MIDIFTDYGLYGVALMMLLDEFGLPMPSSTFLIIYSSKLNTLYDFPIIMFCILLFTALLAHTILFYLGSQKLHKALEKPFILRFISLEHIHYVQKLLKKYGILLLFMSIFMTTIRPLVALLAGASEMSYKRFIIADTIASILWLCMSIGSGYFFGVIVL